jgi:hypothetical protein
MLLVDKSANLVGFNKVTFLLQNCRQVGFCNALRFIHHPAETVTPAGKVRQFSEAFIL